MAYTPMSIRQSARISQVRTVTPYQGENMRDFSGLLDAKQALRIVNYIPDAPGKLRMRKGLKRILNVAGNNPVTLLEQFTADVLIFAYSTTVAAYTISTDTITNIKTNWTAGGTFCGARYGEYFFVSNDIEKIWRVDTALTITEIAASPPSSSLTVLGNRLVSASGTSVQYSEVDTGANPPFTAWTNTSTASAGGIVSYRNAGDINAVVTLGDNVVVFADFGKWAFRIRQEESNGSIIKVDDTIIDRQDLGGESALVTDKGIYYTNEAGIWLLVSLGQPNVPYSDQEFNVSHVLGTEYFEKIDFDGSAIAYDDRDEMLYVSCKRQSSTNNFVIAVNTKPRSYAFARFSNWSINVFMMDRTNTLWAGSAVNTRIYQCFKTYTDDGAAIGTEYVQEINAGDPDAAKTLLKFILRTALSARSELKIGFDYFDTQAKLNTGNFNYCMTAQNEAASRGGYGRSSYSSGYSNGGAVPEQEEDGTVYQYDSYKPMIRNYHRIFVKISGTNKSAHTIHTFDAQIKEKAPIRRRKITTC